MIDFKVLVKVAKTHELDTLKTLGKAIEGNEEAFLDVDPAWVAKQDFITAVPIEVALTMEVRDAVMRNNSNCRFIVTGVPVKRVKTLVDRYSYQVLLTEVTPEPVIVAKDDKVIVAKDDNELAPASGCTYKVNGKEVSAEEFNKQAEKILSKMKAFVESFDANWGF